MKKHFILILIFVLNSLVAQEFIYYDGNQEKKLYLKNDYVIDFSEQNTFSKHINNKGTLIKQNGIAKIYQIKDKTLLSDIKKGTYTKNIGTSYKVSEVFTSQPEGGSMIALPGRIIISFKDSITEQQIQNFLKSRNLNVIRKQNILNKDYYVLSTPAGIASLELANQLRTQPEIEYSKPDLWMDISKR